MKKQLLYLFLLFSAVASAQIVNIPDTTFKSLLLQSPSPIARNADNQPIIVDSNGDGQLQVSEAQNVHTLIASGRNISNFDGIRSFSNLHIFYCDNNNITTIDISNLTHLEKFRCYDNRLTQVNLSGCTDLEQIIGFNNLLSSLNVAGIYNLQQLSFSNNNIENIDFSSNTELSEVLLDGNPIRTLDLRQQSSLIVLRVANCPNLNSLYLKNGSFESFNFGGESAIQQTPNLAYICADENEIDRLEAFLAESGVTGVTVDSACSDVAGTSGFVKDSTVIISPNPSSGIVNIKSENAIKTLEVYDIQGRLLQTITVSEANTTIDLSGKQAGIYIIKLNTDKGVSTEKIVKE